MAFIPLAEGQRTNPAFLASSVQTGESVFDNGGAPWPFLSQINAANYDNGGSVVAFWQPNIGLPNCPAVSPAAQAYRPNDFVDLYASTDDAVAWQVGCNLAGNYYKYQIVVPASPAGPYILNLRVANSSPSAGQTTWTALIDCTSVGSVVGQTTANNNTFVTLQIGAPSGFNVTAGQHTLELLAGGAAGVPAGELSWFQALPAGQVISSISPTLATVDAPCADGTVLGGNLIATLNPPTPAFSGSWTVTGDANFRLGGSGPTGSNVVCNGSVPVGTYKPTVTAHESGLADKSQVFTVTVQTGLTGVCGVGVFSTSSCPPLPAGTTQWVYLGGDEFNTLPGINGPFWYGNPPGALDNGISCAFYANSFVSGGVLHEVGGQPSDCAHQPAYPCDARIAGAHCVGPQWEFCLAGVNPPCDVAVDPGGLYIESRMKGNGPYWAFWFLSISCTCQTVEICGLETDTTENFGGGDQTNYNYGNYGTACSGVTHEPPSGINLSDGSFHTVGTTIISGDGVRQYRDGTFTSLFNNPSTIPYGRGPQRLGVILLLLSGIEGNNGEVDYDWLRIYRAQ